MCGGGEGGGVSAFEGVGWEVNKNFALTFSTELEIIFSGFFIPEKGKEKYEIANVRAII